MPEPGRRGGGLRTETREHRRRSQAAAGAAEENRELVADQLAATTGEDGRRLVKHARYWLMLAESHLTRRLFGSMIRRTDALVVATG